MTPYPSEIEQQMQRLYSSLNEKDRRRYAEIESVKLGWGGMSYISQLFDCDYYTLRLGIEELKDESSMSMSGIRREGSYFCLTSHGINTDYSSVEIQDLQEFWNRCNFIRLFVHFSLS